MQARNKKKKREKEGVEEERDATSLAVVFLSSFVRGTKEKEKKEEKEKEERKKRRKKASPRVESRFKSREGARYDFTFREVGSVSKEP